MKNGIKKYFAAANGFYGFRSYFGTVFDRKEFDRVYILKGGPGTGKSTIMKRILAAFEENGFDCEIILCSSDPSSLDGVIIKTNETKVAILDGTAPHEEDTRYPGAIDEIINLGEAWNEKTLINHRDEIVNLNEKKKQHNRLAACYLEIAGQAFYKRLDLVKRAYTGFDKSEVDDVIIDKTNKTSGRKSNLLLSGFSKQGYLRLESNVKDTISITGKHGSEYIFLEHVIRYLEENDIDYTRIPSPFADDICEGVYFESPNTLLLSSTEAENIVNTSIFLDEGTIQKNESAILSLEETEKEMLRLAKEELEKASNTHFEIESIYGKAVDFEMIDKITEALIYDLKIRLVR